MYEKETELKSLCYDFMIRHPMCHPVDTPNFSKNKNRRVKQKGVADLHCSLYGLFIAVETKIGKNGQSEFQEEYQADIEKSGGLYMLIRSFTVFEKQMDKIEHDYIKATNQML